MRDGNILAERAAALARIAIRLIIPDGEEHTHCSYLWELPSRARQKGHDAVFERIVDVCAVGRPYRACTRLRFWYVVPHDKLLSSRCTGRGVCSISGRPHMQLSGASGQGFNTQAKSEYPRSLCTLLAYSLVTSFDAKRSQRLWNLMN